MTIKEIAKEAGVSKSTVSRVLNGKPDVLPETKAHVMAVVEKYNYQPNVFAKGISQQKSHHIGVVIAHDIDYIFKNQYYDEVLRGLLKAAGAHGYYTILICCEDLKEAVDAAVQKRVDGLIVLSPMDQHKTQLEMVKAAGVPFVTVGRMPAEDAVHQVCGDNYRAGTVAMEHLAAFGHKSIGFINGPWALPSSRERYRAYKEHMDKAGVDAAPRAKEGVNSLESGYELACELFSTVPDLTAIFTASDIMAMGVLAAARDKGKRVPEDLSVVGFDNAPMAQLTTPRLTTVDLSVVQRGSVAVELLMDLIAGEGEKHPYYTELNTSLVVRESTGPVPK